MVRSAQESTNLRINSRPDDVLAAECMRTAPGQSFPGQDLLKWKEAVIDSAKDVQTLEHVRVDRRNPHRSTATLNNLVYLYGHRPQDPKVYFLSIYEFLIYWTFELAKYPRTQEDDDEDPEFHATLTDAGRNKLASQKA